MRVCIKKRKARTAGPETVWDIWIEGPTGGMAVKAVVRTHRRKRTLSGELASEIARDTEFPYVPTVARQAQEKLRALGQGDSSPNQLSQPSREERRKLWREEKRTRAGHALSYIYSASSPLSVRLPQLASQVEQSSSSLPNNAESKVQLRQVHGSINPRERHQFSRRWRKQWVGRALPYLYLYDASPLIARNFAVSSEAGRSSEPLSNSTQGPANYPVVKPMISSSDSVLNAKQMQREFLARAAAQAPRIRAIESTTVISPLDHTDRTTDPHYLSSAEKPSIEASSLSATQRRQQPALAPEKGNQTKPKGTEYAKDAEAGPSIRTIGTEGPEDVLSVTNFQKPADTQNRQGQPRQEKNPLVIKKVGQNSVRRVGVGLGNVEKQGKQKLWRIRKAMKKAFLADDNRRGESQ